MLAASGFRGCPIASRGATEPLFARADEIEQVSAAGGDATVIRAALAQMGALP